MNNNNIQPNLNNIQAFSYAFRMTFGNNNNFFNTYDRLARSQIINEPENNIDINTKDLNSSSNIPLNKNYFNQNYYNQLNIRTDSQEDIEMEDQTGNDNKNNIENQINIESNEKNLKETTNNIINNKPKK